MSIQEKKFSKTVRLPDHLNCKLEKSISTNEIQAIWFDKTARTDYSILWLKVKDKKEIEKTFPQSFQNTVVKEGQLLLDDPTCALIDKFVTTLFSQLQSSNEFKN
ncbi:hypothetical protein H1R17_07310 [Flavobacterium sp. xlx-214]|uniref:hypothetical protein n=1 Tax=unclassified Flavobacterium TaxID=196869 RepID=UPI0013CFE966|nr:MULTISPECIES: hypothetical protein [unclassified Flavobacterium]MBA5792533.1 hypothetical protein [Flavobacterium sp. xlx-221]QMI82316.1 hypothetical protein H1R17_07310 [Flavobacterium sp. xlx-214]